MRQAQTARRVRGRASPENNSTRLPSNADHTYPLDPLGINLRRRARRLDCSVPSTATFLSELMTMLRHTALVTGATDGLGLAVSKKLAEAGVNLILHGRDAERLAAVARAFSQAHGQLSIRTVKADFLSLDEVERMANEILASTSHLDILINNAGIGAGYAGRTNATSVDGIEARFAVNYLAAFHLTERLLPLIKCSSPARIVNVASLGQYAIDFNDIHMKRPGAFDGQRAYGQSKLAQIMHAYDLSEFLAGTDVTANALHPASLMPTKIVHEGWGRTIDTLQEGVDSVVHVALSEELNGVTGRFYCKQQRGKPMRQAENREARATLRRMSLHMVSNTLARNLMPAL
jgi:NAD(P)-dependent dehydrogenase (short-subunit alcohol dehydrogenase family)